MSNGVIIPIIMQLMCLTNKIILKNGIFANKNILAFIKWFCDPNNLPFDP